MRQTAGRWLLRRLVVEALSGDRECPKCSGTGHPYDTRGERFDYDRKCKRCSGSGKVKVVAEPDREHERDVEVEADSYMGHTMTSGVDPLEDRRGDGR